jgi:predicted ArsR family transcriptional regulator
VADISAAMARNGFDPEVKAVRDGAEIVLHASPFATVAVADRETVCALHLGIAEGLAEDDERVTISQLVAYDPRKADCRLRIRVAADGDEVEPSGGGVLSLRGRSSGR